MSASGQIDAVTAHLECETLLLRFHRALDEGRAGEALPLFTADARLEVSGRSAVGQEEIGAALAKLGGKERIAVHLLAGFDFTLPAADKALGGGSIILFVAPLGETEATTTALARYRSRFIRAGDGWLIEEHVVNAG